MAVEGVAALGDPRVCHDDVQDAFLLFDRLIQAVEVVQVGDIALDRGHVLPDQRLRLVQLGLSWAGDKDIRAFGDKPLCGRQTDAAAAAGDQCHFAT